MSGRSLAFSLASIVLGVVGSFLSFFGWMSIVGMALSIVAIIFSSLNLKSKSSGLAVTGLVFGIIGVSACLISFGITLLVASLV